MADDRQDESKLIAERRGKLDALRETGNAFPNTFRRNALADELHRTYGAHENEHLVAENVVVAVAGRMMVKRTVIRKSGQWPFVLTVAARSRAERKGHTRASAKNTIATPWVSFSAPSPG